MADGKDRTLPVEDAKKDNSVKKKKILLVDDDKLILKTLSSCLKVKGYAVTTAGNKDLALLKLKQRPYDIVITDLVLEGTGGIRLLEEAKKVDPDIPVIILTGYGGMTSAIDALRAGADDYLLKPCDIDELLLRISNCLEKQYFRKEIKKYSAALEKTNKNLKAEITKRTRVEEELVKHRHHLQETVKKRTAELSKTNEQLIKEASERKQADEALNESENCYRSLVDNVDLLITQMDSDYNVVMANAALTKKLNKPIKELIGKKCFREFEIRDKVCSHCPGKRAMATRKPQEGETIGFHGDGSLFTVWNRAFPTFGPDGEVTGFLEIGEDITEHKQTMEALRDSEARFRAITEKAAIGIALVKTNGQLIEYNSALQNILGYSKSELCNMHLADYTHPDDLDRDEKLYHQLREGKLNHYQIEKRYIRKDGQTVWGNLTVSLVRDAEGNPQYSIAMVEDITKRKQAEEKLNKDKDYLEKLHNSIAEVIFTVKMPERVIEYVNNSVENIFGYKPKECIGKETEMFYLDKEDCAEFADKIKKTLEQGSDTLHAEQLLKKKNGDLFPSEITTSFLKEDGRVGRVISIVRDITERKRAEEELAKHRHHLEELVDERTEELAKTNKNLKQEISKRKRIEETLRLIVEGTAGVTGEDFLRSLVKQLADVLGVRYAFVGEVMRPAGDRVKTLAVWAGGDYADNFEYDLAGTPCAKVVDRNFCLYPKNIQQQFPLDHLLVEMGVESYMGTTLIDSTGKVIGILVMLDDKPMEKLSFFKPILEIIATRTIAEIERTRVEEALRESEERFRIIFEQAGNSIIVIDSQNGEIVEFNDKTHQNLGYTREEFSKLKMSDIEVVESEEEIMKHIKKIYEDGHDVFETKHRTKRGDIRDVVVNVKSFKSQGKTFLVSIWQDITERKLAENALEKYKILFSKANDLAYVCDAKGNILYLNEAFEKLSGHKTEKFIGKPFTPLFDAENLAIATESYSKTLKGESPKYEVAFKDTGIICEYKNHPSRDEEGNIIGVLGIARDITERKQAEEALRIERDNFISILESMEDGVYIVNQQNDIEYVNPVIEKDFGPVEGMKCFEYFHDRKEVCPWCKNEDVFAGKTVHWEWSSPKNQRTYDLIDTPLQNPDGSVSKLEIFRDITERKQVADALKVAKELAENASAAKSQFLSNMSHELRTPLNSVLGFAQLLESDSDDPLPESQMVSIKQILKSGRHLLDLIKDVLDLSRIESGKLQISVENVAIAPLMEELLTLIRPMAEERDIILKNEICDCDCPIVLADTTRLKQALLNLVSNAVKYNKIGGSVILSCCDTPEGYLRLCVTDTGPGIPEEKISDLFEPFQRLGAEATEVDGTGIGLTIAKRLVELMGGIIGMDSIPDGGSSFYIELGKAEGPVLEKDDVVSLKPTAAPSTDESKKMILYIEDNPASQKLVRSTLKRRSNITLLCAPQAQLGIELACAHRPDLILLDINLPDMNGFEVLKRLKGFKETQNISVIALSANAMPIEIQKGLTAGFIRYITKPIDIPVFLDV